MSSVFTTSRGTLITPASVAGHLVLRQDGRHVTLSPEEQLEAGAWLMAHGRQELRKIRDQQVQELQEELESLRQDAGL